MIKVITLLMIFFTFAFSVDFNTFLNRALTQSPYLQSSLLLKEQAKEEKSQILRLTNPNIGIEGSKFNPSNGKNENGYAVSINQPVRLWGIENDKRAFADAKINNTIASTSVVKANFIKELSLLFTQYAKYKALVNLSKEEEHIAKKILDISSEKLKNGTISKGKMLQAKIAYTMSTNYRITLSLEEQKSYFKLLELSGVDNTIEIDTNHTFNLMEKKNRQNPDILKLKSEENIALASAQLSSNVIETITVTGALENEPSEDIYKIGVSIPLPIFNTKKEEKSIAVLEAKKKSLLVKSKMKKLTLYEKYLKKERSLLTKLYDRHKSMISDKEQLLSMFKEAHEIANIDLLELQNIKNLVLNAKKNFIDTKMKLDKNAIEQNYLQGAYNDK